MPAKAVGFLLLTAIVATGLFMQAGAQGAGVTYGYDCPGRLEHASSSDSYT